MDKVQLYDTTLRDGSQAVGVQFSVNDKVRIAQYLDELGMDYIEGGWPSPSNPRDIGFFAAMRETPPRHARLVAFGSTCRAGKPASKDDQLLQLLACEVPAIAIFGKSWDLHVTHALRIELDENLRMIEDSVAFLRSQGVEVIYDAEHFFDGFRANPDYALNSLRAAAKGGATWIALCDTNGGSLPEQVREALRAAQAAIDVPLGIHAHNDSELAVANSLAAVAEGARMVQGTMNGYGERCGNANLCSVIPNLELKLGYAALPEGRLTHLYAAAHFVAEVANMTPPSREPFVGSVAFSHKGGVHIDSVLKLKRSYEHIDPVLVGNATQLVVSDQAGTSSIVERAARIGITLDKKSPESRAVLSRLKEAEHEGYEFEAAEASFEMLLRRNLSTFVPPFEITDFRVIVGARVPAESSLTTEIIAQSASPLALSEAIVRVKIGDDEEHTVASGDGPVHALDSALRKALEPHFPQLTQVHLTDFKVRVVNVRAGTAARVRVLVETTDLNGNTWNTVGVHENIIVASLEALRDSLYYCLCFAPDCIPTAK